MTGFHHEYPELVDTAYKFQDRGTLLPGDRRPLWRLALVIAILKFASRGGTSSLARLHVLDWAVRSERGREQVLAHIGGRRPPRFSPVRFDPALLRALQFARAEGMVLAEAGKISLTPKGEGLAEELTKNADVYRSERSFLDKIGKHFTEKAADAFIKIGAEHDYSA